MKVFMINIKNNSTIDYGHEIMDLAYSNERYFNNTLFTSLFIFKQNALQF